MKIYKKNTIKTCVMSLALSMGLASCGDFLDRPAEDSENTGTFYKNDTQCIQGVNYLYNSPWYDFQRGFIKIGEVLSGNYYWGSSPYLNFSVNGTDEDLIHMSYSLWAANGHCNTVIGYLKGSSASEAVKKQCIGEALTWKAMAYFFLVRTFGEVPIIHDNATVIGNGSYNDVYKVQRADVYEYIVMTLEEAMKNLKEAGRTTFDGTDRIDYYSAEALLAKVYLTKSGVSGSRSAEDLAKAAEYAKDVIDNSGRKLMPNYSDLFRLSGYNATGECLISWLWSAGRDPWTQQNTLQSDLAMVGFDEFGDCWGGYAGISYDLQLAFGATSLMDPSQRPTTDTRRKATYMQAGDKYEYFWTNKGGFDFLKFIYDADYGKGGPGGELQSATGANCVKHLYGNGYDHEQATGASAGNMYSQLPTHLLRLADVYLIYAEAKMGTSTSTSDASALEAYNAVRGRAIPGVSPVSSITWDDIWKQRRLELAMEGDRWYDYVRRAYYDADGAINDLVSQKRNAIWGLGTVYKTYYETNTWVVGSDTQYDTDTPAPNVTKNSFTLPFPTEDVVFNGHLMEDAIHVDVRNEYSY